MRDMSSRRLGSKLWKGGVHHRGDQETGSGRLGERSTSSDVVVQSGGGAQGKWEVEAMY